MSFEKHPIVAAYLEKDKYVGTDTQGQRVISKEYVYLNIAKALYEKLRQYEEQEAVNSVDPLQMLYKLLNSAAAIGDTEAIDVASKAIQRIKY